MVLFASTSFPKWHHQGPPLGALLSKWIASADFPHFAQILESVYIQR